MNNRSPSVETREKIAASLRGRKFTEARKMGLRGRFTNEPTPQFILSMVIIDKKTGCWNWIGQPSAIYPVVSIFGDVYGVSRLVHLIYHGPIASELDAMHSCDNPRCANPDHISSGTRSENIRDCVEKGRNVGFSGGRHSTESKLKISRAFEAKRLALLK